MPHRQKGSFLTFQVSSLLILVLVVVPAVVVVGPGATTRVLSLKLVASIKLLVLLGIASVVLLLLVVKPTPVGCRSLGGTRTRPGSAQLDHLGDL